MRGEFEPRVMEKRGGPETTPPLRWAAGRVDGRLISLASGPNTNPQGVESWNRKSDGSGSKWV